MLSIESVRASIRPCRFPLRVIQLWTRSEQLCRSVQVSGDRAMNRNNVSNFYCKKNLKNTYTHTSKPALSPAHLRNATHMHLAPYATARSLHVQKVSKYLTMHPTPHPTIPRSSMRVHAHSHTNLSHSVIEGQVRETRTLSQCCA